MYDNQAILRDEPNRLVSGHAPEHTVSTLVLGT